MYCRNLNLDDLIQFYMGSVHSITVFKSSMRVITPIAISLLSFGVSGQGYNVARNPSQIFFTRVLSWSPWKNMMNTDLYTWSPWNKVVQHYFSFPHRCCKPIVNKTEVGQNLTVVGSSSGLSISACRRNTFPLQALHNMRSKGGIRSLNITPATNLQIFYQLISVIVIIHLLVIHFRRNCVLAQHISCKLLVSDIFSRLWSL